MKIEWLLAMSLAAGLRAAQPDQVAKVMAGELKEARASWWGFDKEESTAALQAAIHSRVPRLIVDNMGAPWITDRLTCVSDQEIVFEKGVEVLAKKGAFTGVTDTLFTLSCVTNVTLCGPGATLRMRRADYATSPYARAEWRNLLNIMSCANIRIIGLTLAESGGDGIYLGCQRPQHPNRDILIRDVVCDRNYRQGISVISAENLLIENTVMRGTAGTAPAAGIDFEPNQKSERLKNCVVRNCVTENSQGSGYLFALPHLSAASEPVSIRIENCRSTGDREGVQIVAANSKDGTVQGELVFADCRFEKARRNGLIVVSKPSFGMTVTFDRCAIEACGAGTNAIPDIFLTNVMADEWPVGGIRFNRLSLVQPAPRPWIVCHNDASVPGMLPSLTGTVTVSAQGDTDPQTVELTPEWLKAAFPPRFKVRVPRVKANLAKARVRAHDQSLVKLSPLRFRGRTTFLFHAQAGKEVVLSFMQSPVARYAAGTRPLVVLSPSGKWAKSMPMPPFRERAEFRFTPATTGFHSLVADAAGNAFTLLEANVPVAVDTAEHPVGLIASLGALFVAVPRGTDSFAIGVAGGGEGEAVKATVIDPSGKPVWTKDPVVRMERFTATGGERAAGGLWQIKFERPATVTFEDYLVEVLGIPAHLFLSPERYWEF